MESIIFLNLKLFLGIADAELGLKEDFNFVINICQWILKIYFVDEAEKAS